LSVMQRRIDAALLSLGELQKNWPNVTYRMISQNIGRILSMHPVLDDLEQIKTKMLQTFVNIRNFKNHSWD